MLLSFYTKQASLIRRSTVQILPPQLVFHGDAIASFTSHKQPNPLVRVFSNMTAYDMMLEQSAK